VGGYRAANPGFVYDGYARFWRVAGMLTRDREPPEQEWLDLLGAAGYRDLIAHEFPADFFPESFRVAFKPSLGQELARALQGGPRADLLRHYLFAHETRDRIARSMDLLTSARLAAAARQAALEWLPRGLTPGFPDVAFVIFAPDARGYARVVVDAAYLCQVESPAALLAHEYHHVYRRQLAPPRLLGGEGEADLLWVLDQLEMEGIADQIDKRRWPEEPPVATGRTAEYARSYRQHFHTSPDLLQRLDALLCAWHRSTGRRPEIARRLRASLPLSGHPTGSYMAQKIERAFGREACVGTAGNPFAFMRLYSDAARSAAHGPALSDGALLALKALERTCLAPA